MRDKNEAFKQHVREASANPEFVHHKRFVKWHLEIVERIALELCDHYPEADRDLVEVMAWLHDYGKILDYDHQYETTLTKGLETLISFGFSDDFAQRATDYVEILDKKLELDLHEAPIEVQVVASADGCSHMAGPFLNIFWHEATDKTFTDRTFEELMDLNRRKVEKDWKYKIVLPEARKAFEGRYKFIREQAGDLPTSFL